MSGTWSCAQCTLENQDVADSCAACGSTKPSSRPGSPATVYTCPKCTLAHTVVPAFCEACGEPNRASPIQRHAQQQLPPLQQQQQQQQQQPATVPVYQPHGVAAAYDVADPLPLRAGSSSVSSSSSSSVYQRAVPPAVVVSTRFQHSLCSCCEDCGTFCLALCCPCVVSARNTRKRTGEANCLEPCLVCFLTAPCCGWAFYSASQRQTLRRSLGIQADYCADLCVHCWCPACALTQESLELEDYHAIHGGPPSQSMEAQALIPGVHNPMLRENSQLAPQELHPQMFYAQNPNAL